MLSLCILQKLEGRDVSDNVYEKKQDIYEKCDIRV